MSNKQLVLCRIAACFVLIAFSCLSGAFAESKLGFSAFVVDEEMIGVSEELWLQQRIFLLDDDLSIVSDVKTENGSFVVQDLSDPSVVYSVSDASYACMDGVSYDEKLNSEDRVYQYVLNEYGSFSVKPFRINSELLWSNEIILAFDGIEHPYVLAVPDWPDDFTYYIARISDSGFDRCFEKGICHEGWDSAAWKWPTEFTAVSDSGKVAVTVSDSWGSHSHLYLYDLENGVVTQIGDQFNIAGPILWYDEDHILTCLFTKEESVFSLIDVRSAEAVPLRTQNGEKLLLDYTPDMAMALNSNRTKLAFWSNRFEPHEGVDDLTLNLVDLNTGDIRTLLFTCYSDSFLSSYGKIYVLEAKGKQVFVPYSDYIPSVFFME